VVYDPSTMQRLAVRGDDGSTLGDSFTAAQLRIARPASPPAVEPKHAIHDGALTADLSLLGYDLSREDVNPGDSVDVALYWSALRDIAQDYLVQLHLEDASGRSWAQEKSRPAYGTYPTNLWKKGEVIRDWHDLRVPAETPSGDYALRLTLESEGVLLADLQLGTIRLSGRIRSYEIPPMQHELGYRLGNLATLLGYDVDGTVSAGEMLRLTLYWQCLQQEDHSYTVFVHLLDQDGAIRGQLDGVPSGGEAPTTSWLEGEVVRDQREIPVDAQSPVGEYVLEVGMYDPKTAQRLLVYDAHHNPVGDRILLQEIGVEAER
jgi:hypothetical protein